MNKKKLILTCLIGMLFLSATAMSVNAADQGHEKIKEGNKYEWYWEMKTEGETKNYYEDSTSKSSYSSSGVFEGNITNVDDSTGTVTMNVTENKKHTGPPTGLKSYSNSDTSSYTFSYTDNDGDGLVDSLSLSLALDWIIAGVWENYTEPLDDLNQDLEWAKGNLTDFDYSFNIDDGDQKVSVEVEYKEEDLPWDASTDNESVIYTYSEKHSASFNNFVIESFESRTELLDTSIENKTYLENNDHDVKQEDLDSNSLSVEGGGEEEIPGFGLITLLGVSTAAIIGILYISKRKKLF